MRNGIGIDLGADTIRVSSVEYGLMAEEPSVVAIDQRGYVFDLGEGALEAAERSTSVIVKRPFSRGLLDNKAFVEYILSRVISALDMPMHAAVSVPASFTVEESDTLLSILRRVGFPSASLIPSPLAAMTGAGASLDADCIWVDIGAATTDIMLLLDGRVMLFESIPIAGSQLDYAVREYLASANRLRVAPSAAEALKKRIGAAWATWEGVAPAVRISGKSVDTGRDEIVTVNSTELMNAFVETAEIIVKHICSALHRVPLNKVESLFKNGIYLSGGGALLLGFEHLVGALTGVQTTLAPQPKNLVSLGLSRIATLDPGDSVDAAQLSRLIIRQY